MFIHTYIVNLSLFRERGRALVLHVFWMRQQICVYWSHCCLITLMYGGLEMEIWKKGFLLPYCPLWIQINAYGDKSHENLARLIPQITDFPPACVRVPLCNVTAGIWLWVQLIPNWSNYQDALKLWTCNESLTFESLNYWRFKVEISIVTIACTSVKILINPCCCCFSVSFLSHPTMFSAQPWCWCQTLSVKMGTILLSLSCCCCLHSARNKFENMYFRIIFRVNTCV